MTSYNYDKIPVGYYDKIYHLNKGIQSKWHQHKFNYVGSMLRKGQKHVDIGCGPGTFIGTLSDDICSLGLDISKTQIDYATQAYSSKSKQFDVSPSGLDCIPDDSVDVVTMLELVEHLEDYQNQHLLVEAFRILRSGGRVIITTPDYGGAWPILEHVINRVGKVTYEEQHINHFTNSSLDALLHSRHFHPIEMSNFLFLSPFFGVLSSNLSDWCNHHEPRYLIERYGFLLCGVGFKP